MKRALSSSPAPLAEAVSSTAFRRIHKALRDDRSLLVDMALTDPAAGPLLAQLLQDVVPTGGRLVFVSAHAGHRQQLAEQILPQLLETISQHCDILTLHPSSDFMCLERLEALRSFIEGIEKLASRQREPSDNLTPSGKRMSGARLRALAVPVTPAEKVRLERLFLLGPASATGRIDDPSLSLTSPMKRMLGIPESHCIGTKCPQYSTCYVQASRTKLSTSTVIVTDYQTVLSSLDGTSNLHDVLDQNTILILEDFHVLDSEVRRFYSFNFSMETLLPLVFSLVMVGALHTVSHLTSLAEIFFRELGRYHLSRAYRLRIEENYPVPVRELISFLEQVANVLHQHAEANSDSRLRHLRDYSLRLAERLDSAMSGEDANLLVTIESSSSGETVLLSRPIEITKFIQKLQSRIRLTVLSSPVIRYPQLIKNLSPLAALAESALEVKLQNSHLATSEMLLVVPGQLPDLNEWGWPAAVTSCFTDVLAACPSQVRACLTSDAVISRLVELGKGIGLHLHRDEMSDFVSAYLPQSVPGTEAHPANSNIVRELHDTCCLVIDRLPFPDEEDPLLDVIKERDPGWFVSHSLPQALQQFVLLCHRYLVPRRGRVVLVVLDNRLLSRSYGQLFLECLPELSLSRSIRDISTFLKVKEKSS